MESINHWICQKDLGKAIEAAINKYPNIPARTLVGFLEYAINKIPMGSFGMACLSNQLKEGYMHADDENLAALPEIIRFLYNDFPADRWGNYEKINDHLGL